MRVGVPREMKPGEHRVALTPEGVRSLRALGCEVFVEAAAGEGSGFPDDLYRQEGAAIGTAEAAWASDLVVKVKEPVLSEYPLLSGSAVLFTYLHLAAFPELTEELLKRRVTAIGYETVTRGGGLPLLRPMSEVAGILSIQAGARGLEKTCGGRGVLLPPIRGNPPGNVCVLGAGVAGRTAARVASGFGANVTVLDRDREKLLLADQECGHRLRTVPSSPEAIAEALREADLVVSAVLVAGERAPRMITRAMLRTMRPGAVVVDISIDQGGTFETSRPTTHDSPYYVEEGVVHYCVTNMPGAVPRTSTQALTTATLPYLESFARLGVIGAMRADPGLLAGLNTRDGNVTCPGVAKALGKSYLPPEQAIG
ncbi:MAG: ald [Deltaproteobacteria bacterium]|nr:ald [Deltaproteobacteria bacterium]